MSNQAAEVVVASLGVPVIAEDTQLRSEIVQLTDIVSELNIVSREEYEAAVFLGRGLKQKMADVTAFFKPMKKAANDAHKQVCSRENAMLEPLKKAESILKAGVSKYLAMEERKRMEAEEAARKKAHEEAERKLEEAIAASEAGNEAVAKTAIEEAEFAESMSRSITVQANNTKIAGAVSSKAYEIVSVDEAAVPIVLNGVNIRPVDTKAVMRLIKESGGSIQIPGIAYQETVSVSFRK